MENKEEEKKRKGEKVGKICNVFPYILDLHKILSSPSDECWTNFRKEPYSLRFIPFSRKSSETETQDWNF